MATFDGCDLLPQPPVADAGCMAKKAPVSDVRAWAKQNGFVLGDRGRLPAEVWAAWESRNGSASMPQPRAEVVNEPGVSAAELAAAHARIEQLEQQMSQLTARLDAVEARNVEPRRLFARTR